MKSPLRRKGPASHATEQAHSERSELCSSIHSSEGCFYLRKHYCHGFRPCDARYNLPIGPFVPHTQEVHRLRNSSWLLSSRCADASKCKPSGVCGHFFSSGTIPQSIYFTIGEHVHGSCLHQQ